ncbi:hypothetical protein GCM10025857_01740 [Alicyclobacillus contaminans]|nr:hypothetical protein GCM10025857_01740 [Alicyclobacillus contaminans]
MGIRASDAIVKQEGLLSQQYRKAIGWNGKTLKEMREETDALTKETGHYAGLVNLSFKESDPIRYEKIFSKLRGGLVHARETAKRVAASPIVEQEGELCFTLYTPEGTPSSLPPASSYTWEPWVLLSNIW